MVLILESFTEAFKQKSNSFFNTFSINKKGLTTEKLNQILENIYESADPDTYSKSVIELLKNKSLDSGSLDIIKSLISSKLVRAAVKMRGPGGLGIQSTDFGIGKQVPG